MQHPRMRTVRFGFVGIAATLTYAIIGLTWERHIGSHVLVGNTLAYGISFFISYFGHRCFTFDSRLPHREALPRFMLSTLLGFCVNTSIVFTFSYFSLPYKYGMLAAIIVTPVVTYIVLRLWVFKKGEI